MAKDQTESQALLEKLGQKTKWTRADGEQAVRAWLSSGLGAAEFGRRYGIKRHKLDWWRRRLKLPCTSVPQKKKARAKLAPAIVLGSSAPAVVVRCGGDISVEISDPSTVAPQWLSETVEKLGALR
jgi:hypothetical protein